MILLGYSRKRAIETINDELANNLGNLVSRAISTKMNREQRFPPFDAQLFRRQYSDDGPALVEGLHYMSGKHLENHMTNVIGWRGGAQHQSET